jgi:alpha-L-fucosidase
MKEEVYEQVRTLFRNYGPFDYLYWDGSWLALRPTDRAAAFFWEPGKYRSPTNAWPVPDVYSDFDQTGQPFGLMGIVRKYSPNVICNNRSGWIGDIEVREGTKMDLGPMSKGRPWERNMNFNEAAWGYTTEQKCLTYEQLVEHLINCVVRDGNLLLNFGPDRHGVIPAEHMKVALSMGEWLGKVGEGIYQTRGGPWEPVDNQYGFTQKAGSIFVHLLAGYLGNSFTTPPLDQKVARCMDLMSGRELRFEQKPDGSVTLSGIDRTKHPACTVVALRLATAP